MMLAFVMADPKNSVRVGRGGKDCVLLSYQRISQRALRTFIEKQLDPRGSTGPVASRGGSVPEFLRKPIAACDFRGESGPPFPHWPRQYLCWHLLADEEICKLCLL